MSNNCQQGTSLPTLQEEQCNGEYQSDSCTIHSQAITYLDLPPNSSVNIIIQKLILNQMYQDELIANLTTLVNNPTDTRPYKTYSAILTQVGTSTPTVSILENTLGNIVWSRIDYGRYRGTLTGAFVSGKVFCPPYSSNFGDGGIGSVFLPVSLNGIPQTGWVNVYFSEENYVEIDVYNMEDYAELSSVLSDLPIEIRVYN